MESDKLYRVVFYVGSGWNFVTAAGMFFLIDSLPAMLKIEMPRYPVFIYFNLMSIFFFGVFQFSVARHLRDSHSMVVILVWAKITMGCVFAYAAVAAPMPAELFSFLLPGMIIDVVFGLVYYRVLRYLRIPKLAAA
ncbi:MAG: hypothetical protein HY966_05655 [Ignavibacteriales bacterium]|nr:hypothetical protein [Ignavibacteriales bacterium]